MIVFLDDEYKIDQNSVLIQIIQYGILKYPIFHKLSSYKSIKL